MVFHDQPTDPWIDMDFLLLEAYQIMQDEVCSRCGNPVWLCRSSSNTFRFTVETVICHAERALKEYDDLQLPRESREKDNKVKAEWGLVKFAKPTPWEKEVELPTRRDYLA